MLKDRGYTLFGTSHFYRKLEANPTDERLSIPKLRRSSVRNVRTTTETYAYADPLTSKMFSGIAEYIRTRSGEGRTPTYIFDQHNHALFGWYEALKEGRIERGAALIHIDEHADANRRRGSSNLPGNLSEVASYVKRAQIYDFIDPAVQDGLVSEFVWVRPLFSGARIENRPTTSTEISRTEIGIESPVIAAVIRGEIPRNKLILDIDIDYFRYILEEPTLAISARDYEMYSTMTPEQGQERLLQRDINLMKALIARAGVVTIATSPGYIDQEQAVDLVKKII